MFDWYLTSVLIAGQFNDREAIKHKTTLTPPKSYLGILHNACDVWLDFVGDAKVDQL